MELVLKILRKIVGKLESFQPVPVNPADYTTTAGPMEVPVQKEAYFFILNNYVKAGDKVLDVGCGIGYGLNLLAIKAGIVHGVDVDQKAIDYCRERVLGKNPKLKALKHYNGYSLPYKNKEFDVVTCIDVIEHVEDYDRFIKELLRVAKRAVVFDTPNRRPEHTNPDGTPKNPWHLREWSYAELNSILEKRAARLEWFFIDGPWEGPFKISRRVNHDTMALMPVLHPKNND